MQVPIFFKISKFFLVDGCSHILTFIAGTKKIGLFDAKITVDANYSEDPFASFEIVFAVVGTTRIKSAHLDKLM